MKKALIAFIFGLFMSVTAFAQTGDELLAQAQHQLIIGNKKKSCELFKKSASLGNAEAQRVLGIMYYSGDGVRQNYKKARKWFMKSAENDDDVAQYWLGRMYIQGHGGAQDYTKAFEWMHKSATSGYAEAQVLLAFSCQNQNIVVFLHH
jgi:TPR repeat protein